MKHSYAEFLARKAITAAPVGIDAPGEMPKWLFPFQHDIVRWGLRRGRCAFFADTGLGKTAMQLAWAERIATHTNKPALILTPLAVAAQTVAEGAKFGVTVTHARAGADRGRITVTNYDRLHRFDPSDFGSVVLDESSCLKDYTAATRNELIQAFAATPFKLACTATPAPNDFIELGNHAEFLGAMSRVEMLSMFFVHDGGSTQDWRIKGHAENDFWRWVCSWGLMVKSPADLGYDPGRFELPPLNVSQTVVDGDLKQAWAAGQLFVTEAATLQEQRAARRGSLEERVATTAAIVAREPTEPWLIWCDLNDEGDALERAIPGAVQVRGSDDVDDKIDRLLGFASGKYRVLVTKPSIAAWGLNYQHCARVAFVGVSHSFEQYYQAVRRCWRFGQTRPVEVHLVVSEGEGRVLDNLLSKQEAARLMGESMREHTAAIVREEIGATSRRSVAYTAKKKLRVPAWLREGA